MDQPTMEDKKKVVDLAVLSMIEATDVADGLLEEELYEKFVTSGPTAQAKMIRLMVNILKMVGHDGRLNETQANKEALRWARSLVSTGDSKLHVVFPVGGGL